MVVAGVRQHSCYSLPVAGLDEAKAQPIWFALRRAAVTAEEVAVADRWLEALQVCQVASSLLLSEVDEVEANLRFWHAQEQRGRHFWTDLLRRGPLHFAGRVAVLLHLRQPEEGELTQADLVEKRVLIFRLLRSALCEALAQVQTAAAQLYLQQQQGEGQGLPPPPPGAAPRIAHTASAGEIAAAAPGLAPASGGASGAVDEGLFHRADRLVTASLAGVSAAFRQLDASVHATLDAQQGPAAPPAQDWQVLQGAMTRVLGLTHLRSIFSRAQLQPGAAGAAGDAAPAAGAAGPAGAPQQPAALPAAGGAVAAAAEREQAPASAATALVEARRAVGFTQLLPANATVHGALQAAQRSARAMRGRRLIQVPHWVRMPSELQRNWIRYTVISAAAGWGTIFLYRHSRLSGSPDLDNWARAAVVTLRGAYASHVVAPLAAVKDELFNTFRRRPTITSMSDYEADRDSLRRMLDDFHRDFSAKRGAPALPAAGGGDGPAALVGPAEDVQLLAGMDLVMRTYEREMQHPLRNLVGGELVRALLIQVQKLKVDTASAMLEMDQILKANELSISLLAAVPAFLIAGSSLYYLGGLITPTPPDPRREALPVRMAFVEVERALECVAAAEEAAAAAAGQPVAELGPEGREQYGLLAYRLAVTFEAAKELFRRHRGLIAVGGSEWPNIRTDLLELSGPGGVSSKMRTAQRMARSYSIFQQF